MLYELLNALIYLMEIDRVVEKLIISEKGSHH